MYITNMQITKKTKRKSVKHKVKKKEDKVSSELKFLRERIIKLEQLLDINTENIDALFEYIDILQNAEPSCNHTPGLF